MVDWWCHKRLSIQSTLPSTASMASTWFTAQRGSTAAGSALHQHPRHQHEFGIHCVHHHSRGERSLWGHSRPPRKGPSAATEGPFTAVMKKGESLPVAFWLPSCRQDAIRPPCGRQEGSILPPRRVQCQGRMVQCTSIPSISIPSSASTSLNSGANGGHWPLELRHPQ